MSARFAGQTFADAYIYNDPSSSVAGKTGLAGSSGLTPRSRVEIYSDVRKRTRQTARPFFVPSPEGRPAS